MRLNDRPTKNYNGPEQTWDIMCISHVGFCLLTQGN